MPELYRIELGTNRLTSCPPFGQMAPLLVALFIQNNALTECEADSMEGLTSVTEVSLPGTYCN